MDFGIASPHRLSKFRPAHESSDHQTWSTKRKPRSEKHATSTDCRAQDACANEVRKLLCFHRLAPAFNCDRPRPGHLAAFVWYSDTCATLPWSQHQSRCTSNRKWHSRTATTTFLQIPAPRLLIWHNCETLIPDTLRCPWQCNRGTTTSYSSA